MFKKIFRLFEHLYENVKYMNRYVVNDEGGWFAAAAGLAIMLGSAYKASQEESPTMGTVKWPRKTPFEQQMIDYQAGVMSDLREEVRDPEVMEAIYSSLPEGTMSPEAAQKFELEFSEVSAQASSAMLQNTGKIYGENVDELRRKGLITSDQADRQKIMNQAALNAVQKQHENKMNATQGKAAISSWMSDQTEGLQTAEAIASVRNKNMDLLDRALTDATRYKFEEKKGEMNLIDELKLASSEFDITNAETKNNMYINMAGTAANTFSKKAGQASEE